MMQSELSKFNQELLSFLQTHNIASVNSINGDSLCLLELPTNLVALIPTLNFEKCRQCKLCTQICLNKAVYIANKEIEIDKEKCQGCGHCVSMCPENALTL